MRIMRLASAGLVVIGLSVMPGCSKSANGPTFTDVATAITAKPGKEFSVTLNANITTGYTWEFKTEPDSKVVVLVDQRYEAPPASSRVGEAGKQRFRFKAVAAGSAKLDLQYVRPWEDPRQAVQTAVFTVTIA